MLRKIAIPAIAIALTGAAAQAQPGAASTSSNSAAIASDGIDKYFSETGFRDIEDDFLVPSSPAFAILGASPENVVRPSTPKEFGAALLDGVDATGTLQAGVAIEFSPHLLFNSGTISLDDYRSNRWRRILARSQFSIATTRAASDGDEALRLAIGFRAVLFDKSDVRWNDEFETFARTELEALTLQALQISEPVYAVAQCRLELERNVLAKGYLILVSEGTCPPPPSHLAAILTPTTRFDQNEPLRRQLIGALPSPREEAAKALEAARNAAAAVWENTLDDFRESAWNASNVTVGGALTLASEDGSFGGFGETGYAVYVTGAYGFEGVSGGLDDNAHFIAHLRYQTNQLVTATEDGVDPFLQDVLTAGAQLRIRGPELNSGKKGRNLTFFGEVDYMRADPDGMATDESMRYAAGLDIALTDRVSFQVSAGEQTGSEFQLDSTFVLGDLKWSF